MAALAAVAFRRNQPERRNRKFVRFGSAGARPRRRHTAPGRNAAPAVSRLRPLSRRGLEKASPRHPLCSQRRAARAASSRR